MKGDPMIVWKPAHPEKTQLHRYTKCVEQTYHLSLNNYEQLHAWSIEHPDSFWQSVVDFFKITFDTPPIPREAPIKDLFNTAWFSGATLNFAEQLLSRRDDHPAIISMDEQGKRRCLRYNDLYEQVTQCAAGLKKAGVKIGDRVAAIMPNGPETIVAMLATASIGAIWSSCSPDFGVDASVDRLGQLEPGVLFICDGHYYHGKTHVGTDKIQAIARQISTLKQVVIYPVINAPFDTDTVQNACYWDDFLIPARSLVFESLPFAHPLYILFSSGTTGKPKCIIHGAGGTLVQHLKELGLHTDLTANDNLFFFTTCGWMMWNWMVSALALGTTLTLYDGSPTYPTEARLFEFIEAEQVTVFGTSAKFLSAVQKADVTPNEHHAFPSLRCILSTGSPLLPAQYDFVYEAIKRDVQLSSISGGTDILSCFALGNPVLPIYRGELQCIGLGMAVSVFNEEGLPIKEARGELVCTKPFPSMPIGFWNDPDKRRYHQAYFERFPGVWAHGDFAEITPHNGLIIHGRSDAILNPGGVRIGTAEIYRQIERMPEILDSIVIGQTWKDDVRVVLFVKLQEDLTLTTALIKTIQTTIRKNASPRHVPAKILQVPAIPKTISGKLVEVAVRQAVHGEPILNTSALANPEALDYFKQRPELDSD